jgi:uncharacterized protein (TIGR03435 family)
MGGPGWIDADNFDVQAIADRNPSREQQQMMLRALLADRFKLAIHRETRELPIYNLVKSSGDATAGDKLRASDIDCDALRKSDSPDPGRLRSCMMVFGRGSLHVSGMTAFQFATGMLARVVNRPVIDRTGLGTTLYDWALEWTPDQPSPAAAGTTPSDLPTSIFSALQEQLGLTLESAKGPVDVLVVDRIEKPTLD